MFLHQSTDLCFCTNQVMTVTLSADQRVYSGDVGAKMLAAFKANMESPSMLMLS